jgi:citrate lyase subunit beta/citryl-CoA lyase
VNKTHAAGDPIARIHRSALYLPASNPKAISKAQTLPCDTVILDLEDSVAPEAKESARQQAAAAVRQGSFGSRTVVIRVNGLETAWGADDMEAASAASPDAILVPKIDSIADIRAYQQRLGGECRSDLWVMIETPRSILNIREIAAASLETRLACLVMGTNDLAKDLNAKPGASRTPFWGMFGLCVAAARAFGLLVLDGVYNNIEDSAGFKQQCLQAVEFGFDGKTLIHPTLIQPCNEAFSPDAAAIEGRNKLCGHSRTLPMRVRRPSESTGSWSSHYTWLRRDKCWRWRVLIAHSPPFNACCRGRS